MTVQIIQPPEGAFGVPQIDVERIKRKFLDIPYAAESPNQLLDIFLPPEGDGPFPTLIYIHGGGFFMGDKRDAQLHCPYDGINRVTLSPLSATGWRPKRNTPPACLTSRRPSVSCGPMLQNMGWTATGSGCAATAQAAFTP